MKLSYRGVSYEAEPQTVEVTEGEICGTYRGQAWRVHRYKLSRPRYLAPVELTYRGLPYRQN